MYLSAKILSDYLINSYIFFYDQKYKSKTTITLCLPFYTNAHSHTPCAPNLTQGCSVVKSSDGSETSGFKTLIFHYWLNELGQTPNLLCLSVLGSKSVIIILPALYIKANKYTYKVLRTVCGVWYHVSTSCYYWIFFQSLTEPLKIPVDPGNKLQGSGRSQTP